MNLISRTLLCAVLLAATGSITRAAGTDPLLHAALVSFDEEEHPDLRGVVVMREGQVVAERYYNGETADTLHDIRSAGKSITSLVFGIAIDQGKIRSVSDAVSRYWPEAKGHAIGDVRLRDVLSMRSGLAAFDEDQASPGNEDRMDEAADPLAFVLGVPRADEPGTRYRYNSVTAYVAGVVIAKATGTSLADYARLMLFAPLGITKWEWSADAAGYTKGQGNLSMTTRALAVIGEMVRGGGVYQGSRIVSAEWLREALAPTIRIADSDPYADSYGYMWYAKTHDIDGNPVFVSFASGNGGNKLYVVPSRHLVVAITSSAYGRGYGQKRSERILKAVLVADGATRQTSADGPGKGSS